MKLFFLIIPILYLHGNLHCTLKQKAKRPATEYRMVPSNLILTLHF